MFGDKLKKIFNKNKSSEENNDEGSSKKKIENLVVFHVILIITIFAINIIWNDDKARNNSRKNK